MKIYVLSLSHSVYFFFYIHTYIQIQGSTVMQWHRCLTITRFQFAWSPRVYVGNSDFLRTGEVANINCPPLWRRAWTLVCLFRLALPYVDVSPFRLPGFLHKLLKKAVLIFIFAEVTTVNKHRPLSNTHNESQLSPNTCMGTWLFVQFSHWPSHRGTI